MPTTVTSKIGATNSPTTMDFSTLQSWEDACPANLVTDDKIWEGQVYNQGELLTSSGVTLTIAGETVDSTRYISLKTATGASFRDNGSVRSNALDYNSSNGACARSTSRSVIDCSVGFTRIDGLQLYANGASYGNNAILLSAGISSSAVTVTGCILKSSRSGSAAFSHGSGGRTDFNLYNCLMLSTNNAPTASANGSTVPNYIGCTAVQTGGTAGASFANGNYGTATIKDCAGFGGNAFKSGSQTASGSSGYNATDQSSAFGSTGNLTSLTFASQFQSSTNDFRAVSSGSLDGAGTPDSTNIPTDISGTTRDVSTPTIGCWEVVSAGATARIWQLAATGDNTAQIAGNIHELCTV